MIYGIYLFQNDTLEKKMEVETISIDTIMNYFQDSNAIKKTEDHIVITEKLHNQTLMIISGKKDDDELLKNFAKESINNLQDFDKIASKFISVGIHGILLSFYKENKRSLAFNKFSGTVIFSSFSADKSTNLSMMCSALAMGADETALAMHLGDITDIIVSGDEKQAVIKEIADGILLLVESLPDEVNTTIKQLEEIKARKEL